MRLKIEDIDLAELELTDWVDPRIPSWWWDTAVWRYLGQKYGLRAGGIVDDSELPTLVIESIN